MKLIFPTSPTKSSVLICPLFEDLPPGNFIAKFVKTIVSPLKELKEFEPKEGRTYFLYQQTFKNLPRRILLLGLGKSKKLKTSSVMACFGASIKAVMPHKPRTLSLIFPEPLTQFTQAIAEALTLGQYQPGALYKTGKAAKKMGEQRVKTLEIITNKKLKEEAASFRKGLLIGGAANELRDWVNAPPNRASAQFFEDRSREIAKETGAKLRILKNKELLKLGMGALLSVNRGSPDEARLIIMDYHPKGISPQEKPIVLAGKGIIFDSGGYHLKPAGHLEDMQLDKAGAATVIALPRLLYRFGVQKRVVVVAPFTENLIGATATKPSEIIKTYSGKTVEITNTDAEGRLVLCDAIAYAIDTFKPSFLLDIATLTGACMIALGERYAGLFGNDKELMEKLKTAGEAVDELLWPMPIHKDDAEKLKGYYADLQNHDQGTARNAGASKGAAFLQEFVGKTKWAHLDIAGPAFVSDPKKYEVKGATGFGLRVLLKFIENL